MAFASVFFPPELAMRQEEDTGAGADLGGKTDLLRRLYFERQQGDARDEALDRRLVSLVLEHARQVVAHPSRPILRELDTFDRHPFAELALEETLEESPLLEGPENYLVELQREKPLSCVTILDCSSSMSGDKHLLASIAVAVLLLEVAPKQASLVVFSSQAKTIKRIGADDAPEQTVLRFLKHQSRGFTNIHRGLEEGLRQAKAIGGRRRKVGLIATDGRTTEGGDPLEVARLFDALVVLHLHGPGSHLEASQEMAQKGHGVCLEVENFEALPRKMYDALRWISRM